MSGASAPIGMFDSGVGGLAVLAEVRRLLPGEDILYYADTAHFPYGSRSASEVRARSETIAEELIQRGAKVIAVACNTATSAAIAGLRQRFDVPFVGMEPALKPAAEQTESGTVALLVTPGTARGHKLASLIDRHGHNVRVEVIEAPGLAERVEHGEIDATETGKLVRKHANAVKASGADVLALGCTHYAFLQEAFAEELGPGVQVIEPSEAVARQVVRVLEEGGLRNQRQDGGSVKYTCSGDEQQFASGRERLIGRDRHIRKEALSR